MFENADAVLKNKDEKLSVEIDKNFVNVVNNADA